MRTFWLFGLLAGPAWALVSTRVPRIGVKQSSLRAVRGALTWRGQPGSGGLRAAASDRGGAVAVATSTTAELAATAAGRDDNSVGGGGGSSSSTLDVDPSTSPVKRGGPMFFKQLPSILKNKLLIVFLLLKLGTLKVQSFGRNLTTGVAQGLSNSAFGKTKVGKALLRIGAQVWLRLFCGLMAYAAILKYVKANRPTIAELSFANFLKLLDKHPDKISALRVSGSTLNFLFSGKQVMTRVVQTDSVLLSKLIASGVDFASAPAQVNVLGLVWTFVYGVFLWTVTSRMLQGPQDEGAGRRRDKTNFGSLSFADVAGQERAKLEVREVCEMLRAPGKYASVGARVPAGVLLVGPPGTGKTLLARVAAAEAGVPFYACSATDFVEVFVGRGPARVRKLFKSAAENAPCIVFIDEIDSIGRSRRSGSLNSEQENTLNQLLTSMDGLDTSNNGVVVMAATNRFELLDPALMRAGRFDRVVQCPLPDKEGRRAILAVHAKRLQLDRDVDLERLARITPGTCGADLAAIANEAAIRTARRGGGLVSEEDFEDAVRSFFAGRGVSMSGLAESMLPAWLSRGANGGGGGGSGGGGGGGGGGSGGGGGGPQPSLQ